MTTPQRSALESRERIQDNIAKMLKQKDLFCLSGIGLIGLLTTSLISWKNDTSPELTVASGLGAAGCFAWSLIELARMVKITQSTYEETTKLSKMGGSIPAIIAPLSERPSPKERKQLTAYQAPMVKLLASGQPDSGPVDLEVAQSDELLTLAGPRIQALEFILSTLLDPRVKRVSLRGPQERIEVLKQLRGVLAGPSTSLGLPVTEPEAYISTMLLNLSAMTEKAPEVMVEHLYSFAALIENYVLNGRITPRGKAMVDDLMMAAVRAELLTGVAVAPPIGEWQTAQSLKDEEVEKVVLKEGQVIAFAKSMAALGNNRSPEVREAFLQFFRPLKKLLVKENQRLEGLNQNSVEQNIELAVINRVLAILDISMEKLLDNGIINTLNQLFNNSLSSKTRIAPRVLMDEFKRTRFGFWSIEDDRIVVFAQTVSLADALACAVVLCYPHVPRIEICIKKDINEVQWGEDERIVDQSAMTETGVFYFQRIIKGNKQFTRELIGEQSPKAEAGRPSVAPALLEAAVPA